MAEKPVTYLLHNTSRSPLTKGTRRGNTHDVKTRKNIVIGGSLLLRRGRPQSVGESTVVRNIEQLKKLKKMGMLKVTDTLNKEVDLEQLSPSVKEAAPPIDTTGLPPGHKRPTLAQFVEAGYLAENYESHMKEWEEGLRRRAERGPAQPEQPPQNQVTPPVPPTEPPAPDSDPVDPPAEDEGTLNDEPTTIPPEEDEEDVDDLFSDEDEEESTHES